MMKKQLSAFLLSLVMVLGMLPAGALAAGEELPFQDVTADAWYLEAVQYAYENKLMDGTGGGRFSPDVTTTRAVLVTLLYRGEGEPAVESDKTFPDVAAGAWYTNAVIWAAEQNIVNGYDDGGFHPDDTLTREQFATMLYRYTAGKGMDVAGGTLSEYPDADQVSTWAKDAMAWAVHTGLINGMGDGTLSPWSGATRAQAAVVVMRYHTKVDAATKSTAQPSSTPAPTSAASPAPSAAASTAKPSGGSVGGGGGSVGGGGGGGGGVAPAATSAPTGTPRPTATATPSQVPDDADVWVGTYIGNDRLVPTAQKGEIALRKTVTSVGENGKPVTSSVIVCFPSDLGIENMGEEVKVLYKDGDGGVPGKPDGKDTIYRVTNTGATKVIRTTCGMIQSCKTAGAKLNVGGTEYNVKETGVTVCTNYAATSTITGVKGADPVPNVEGTDSALTKALQGFNGDSVKLVFDDSHEIIEAYVERSVLGVVAAVSNGKVYLSSIYKEIGALNIADNDVYDGVAKGDVVAVKTLYQNTPTDAKAFNVITKADVVSGTVESYKDTENVAVDGVTYGLYNGARYMHTAGLTGAVSNFSSRHIGGEFDLYLVNGYVGAAVQTAEAASEYYSVIVDSNADTSTLGSAINGTQIIVLGADGIRTVLAVSSESVIRTSATTTTKLTDANKADALKKGNIVTYTIDHNGHAEVTVEARCSIASVAGEIAYLEDTKTIRLNGKAYSVAADAVLFSYADDDTAATESVITEFKADILCQTGDNAVAAGGKYTVVIDWNGVVRAIYMNQKAQPKSADTGDNTGNVGDAVCGIVTAKVGDVKIGGANYVRYTVAVNEDTYTVNISNTLASTMESDKVTPLKKGAIVRLIPNADGIYTAAEFKAVKATDADTLVGFSKEYNETDGTVTVYTGIRMNGLMYEGTNPVTYAVADDVSIFYVDQNADVGVLGAIGGFDAISGLKNIVIIVDEEMEVTHIIYETSNKWDILNSGL